MADKIESFIDIEAKFLETNQQDNAETQSNTYEELTRETAFDNAYRDIEVATAHEQDV
jgi:hypothetical protein